MILADLILALRVKNSKALLHDGLVSMTQELQERLLLIGPFLENW